MHSNPFSSAGYDLRDMESKVERKADKHEVHSINSSVDCLQHSLREARAETDSLRNELSQLREDFQRLADSIAERVKGTE